MITFRFCLGLGLGLGLGFGLETWHREARVPTSGVAPVRFRCSSQLN
jgi:hypothetical protein